MEIKLIQRFHPIWRASSAYRYGPGTCNYESARIFQPVPWQTQCTGSDGLQADALSSSALVATITTRNIHKY